MNKFVFTCPVCGQALGGDGKTLGCAGKHSFDIASSGYVNLLRSPSARTHGDDKVMARARRDFLSRGYYKPIADAVAGSILKLSGGRGGAAGSGPAYTLLDAGCGEGYYTGAVAASLAAGGMTVAAAGVDISRDMAALAAKTHISESFAVASAYSLPAADGYCDFILSLFAPFPEAEFRRAVRHNGFILRVTPCARHLWELKQLLYEVPRENDPVPGPETLSLVSRTSISYKINVARADLANLFMMTPYFHRTSREDTDKLAGTDGLETTIAVDISVYSKKI